MEYTLLLDVRYSGSFVEGTRMIQGIFDAAHRLSRDARYAIDFPAFKGIQGVDPAHAHMSAFGNQVRLFGQRDHLRRVCDNLIDQYGNALFFPEGESGEDGLLKTGGLPVVGYAKVFAKRPRKSAAQAAERLRRHLEKRGVTITHPITEGDPDYRLPNGKYLTYKSHSTGKRFPFYIQRDIQKADQPVEIFTAFDRFGLSRGGWLPIYDSNKIS